MSDDDVEEDALINETIALSDDEVHESPDLSVSNVFMSYAMS